MNSRLKETMSEIVEKKLTRFKDDFYKYDMVKLENAPKDAEFIWCLKETGTHLIPVDRWVDPEVGSEFLRLNDDYYRVNVSKPVLQKISREEAEKAVEDGYALSFDKMRVNEVRVFNDRKDPRHVKYFVTKLSENTAEALMFWSGNNCFCVQENDWREVLKEIGPAVPGKGYPKQNDSRKRYPWDDQVVETAPYGYMIPEYGKFVGACEKAQDLNAALEAGKAVSLYFDRKEDNLKLERVVRKVVSLAPENNRRNELSEFKKTGTGRG